MSTVDLDGPLDAVLLFRRTGGLVAGWARNEAPQEVLSVMAATMFGSLQTLIEALGDSSPSEVAVETGGRRLLAARCGPREAVLVVAPSSVSKAILKRVANRVIQEESRKAVPDRTGARGVIARRQ